MYFTDREDAMALHDLNSGDEPLLSAQYNSYVTRTYDYVLVADKVEDNEAQMFKKQEAFINELKRKNMKVTSVEHVGKVFIGVCAPEEVFAKYKYLLKVSDGCNWSEEQNSCQDQNIPFSTRIRIVHFVLHNTFIGSGESLEDLLKNGVFESIFCLHEKKEQKKLKKKWASWFAVLSLFKQPVTDVKEYFGEKVALYYLWLGWYTRMLIPAAVIGVVVFLYGVAFFNTSPLIKEVCDSNILMCPRCDKKCSVWNLSDTCTYSKVSQLFDNEGTVAFAMFMAIWATLFLELWKRHRALYVSKWNMFDWCEEEEELILEIVNNPQCKPKEYRHSYLRSILVILLVTLVLVVIIGLANALVICRVLAAILFSESNWHFLSHHASTLAMLLGAVLHYITIQVMTRINRIVALKLCEFEKTRSFAATEKSFTVKMFTFQFFTLFSSLFYVAFFLGRINGYPGKYVRIAGYWRLEECHPSGCLTDLFIQMAVIMVLKQTINNIFEFTVPWLKLCFKRTKAKTIRRKCGNCYRKACREEGANFDPCDLCKLHTWLDNYDLSDVNAFSLFNEFLEMVIQFSFTTIFVAAFPLAPLLAFINNIFEIRLDAIKMVSLERRLVSKKTNDIGVWTRILEAVGVMAVIANGLVIGVSSDFIPRLVYRYYYGPCVNGTSTDLDCMTGYINDTLATAYMWNTNVRDDFKDNIAEYGLNFSQCSYKDYRSNEDQALTSQFWLILAIRFAFVILFEHVVVLCKFVAAWFIPDNPIRVKNVRLEDKLRRLKKELQEISARYDSKSTEV
ncbi:anoctamin-9-like [Myxocyprinus asiaticus]|uniref:anoctamin-9-like n=1 Tax=Myxocyprinus asiaticus TaxID=70543 RepID=UPI0022226855|nr:anoctamin-9-like [Myxocyprinus asiaticus]